MKKLVSISVFAAALLIGVFLPLNTPTIYEKMYPTFSSDEINSMLGKTVINKSNTWRRRGMKYSLDSAEDMTFEVSQNGETGKVVDLQEVMAGKDVNFQKIMIKGCNLLVKWDEKSKDGKDMFSCDGRFSSRVYLEFK